MSSTNDLEKFLTMGNVIDQFAQEMDLLIGTEEFNDKKNKKELYYFNDCPHCIEYRTLIQNNNINNLSSLFSCPDITKCDCLINTPLKCDKNRIVKSSNTITTNISENQNCVSKENINIQGSPDKGLAKTPINNNPKTIDQNCKSPYNSLKLESPSTFLRFHL